MKYGVRENLEGRDSFLSVESRIDHYRIYKSFVQHSNSIIAELEAMRADGRGGSLLYQDRVRRLAFEVNGKTLHELYFENLGQGSLDVPSRLEQRIEKSFGSMEVWKSDFRHVCASRGEGWGILFDEPQEGRLLNLFINSNHVGQPFNMNPILVLDLWEHAYIRDFGAHGRANFVDKALSIIDFQVVDSRLSC